MCVCVCVCVCSSVKFRFFIFFFFFLPLLKYVDRLHPIYFVTKTCSYSLYFFISHIYMMCVCVCALLCCGTRRNNTFTWCTYPRDGQPIPVIAHTPQLEYPPLKTERYGLLL